MDKVKPCCNAKRTHPSKGTPAAKELQFLGRRLVGVATAEVVFEALVPEELVTDVLVSDVLVRDVVSKNELLDDALAKEELLDNVIAMLEMLEAVALADMFVLGSVVLEKSGWSGSV